MASAVGGWPGTLNSVYFLIVNQFLGQTMNQSKNYKKSLTKEVTLQLWSSGKG